MLWAQVPFEQQAASEGPVLKMIHQTKLVRIMLIWMLWCARHPSAVGVQSATCFYPASLRSWLPHRQTALSMVPRQAASGAVKGGGSSPTLHSLHGAGSMVRRGGHHGSAGTAVNVLNSRRTAVARQRFWTELAAWCGGHRGSATGASVDTLDAASSIFPASLSTPLAN